MECNAREVTTEVTTKGDSFAISFFHLALAYRPKRLATTTFFANGAGHSLVTPD